jgi:hypothetical protein
MKGQLAVRTPDEYLARLEEPRRTEVTRLHRLIRSTVPTLEPGILGGMLAYGPVHYRYASGREGDAARVAVASNASSISLYAFAADEGGWVAERYRERLPKAKVGKSCVRFKRLDDLDVKVLQQLLKEAASSEFPAHLGEVRDVAATRADLAGHRDRVARTRVSARRRVRTGQPS